MVRVVGQDGRDFDGSFTCFYDVRWIFHTITSLSTDGGNNVWGIWIQFTHINSCN